MGFVGIPQEGFQGAVFQVVEGYLGLEGGAEPLCAVVGEITQRIVLPIEGLSIAHDGEHNLAVSHGVGEAVIGLVTQMEVLAVEAFWDG